MTTETKSNNHPPNKWREIKSFVLRQGRLTHAQQIALDLHWKDYGLEFSKSQLNFSTLFDNHNNTIVEIGFGNGESLFAQAQQQTDTNFIGIEVHRPGVGHLIHLAKTAELNNLKIFHHDAIDVLNQQIPNQSLHSVQLFFPDPWQKRKHHKRRIIKPEFIALIHKKLKPNGIFHMATDWQHYAAEMLKQMDLATGFSNNAGKGLYSPSKGKRYPTKFERRGIKLGHNVWDLIYIKQPI